MSFEEDVTMTHTTMMTHTVRVENEFVFPGNHVQGAVRVGDGADASEKSDLWRVTGAEAICFDDLGE